MTGIKTRWELTHEDPKRLKKNKLTNKMETYVGKVKPIKQLHATQSGVTGHTDNNRGSMRGSLERYAIEIT